MRASVRLEGLSEVSQALSLLRTNELPTALRNATNDTARDVIKRLERETQSVFDRPTPRVKSAFFLKEKATKERPQALIAIKDVFGKDGEAIVNTLTPHIPGFDSTRRPKGMERQLRRKGLLGPGQYLVPSRTLKLDRFGNVSGAQASKMLSDINAYTAAGGSRATGASKVRYIWGTVRPKGRAPITGIWLQSRWQARKQNALVMLAVDSKPSYAKRFRFNDVADRYAGKVFLKHMTAAV
ncbi:MAG: hypothetical protein VBE63_18200, partial [Lamprobacter sp.]|nr:hypothetical protein [Lamprobacter sp.]